MTDVFVLTDAYPYEGESVLGVFSTLAAAKAHDADGLKWEPQTENRWNNTVALAPLPYGERLIRRFTIDNPPVDP